MITKGSETNAFIGNWDTTWTNAKATTPMQINPNGTGSFAGEDGKLIGSFNADNTVYTGHWEQKSNKATGEFTFTLKTPLTFQGTFTRTSPRGEGGPWNGTKVS